MTGGDARVRFGPGEVTADVIRAEWLFFDPPVPDSKWVDLDLPGSVIGLFKPFCFCPDLTDLSPLAGESPAATPLPSGHGCPIGCGTGGRARASPACPADPRSGRPGRRVAPLPGDDGNRLGSHWRRERPADMAVSEAAGSDVGPTMGVVSCPTVGAVPLLAPASPPLSDRLRVLTRRRRSRRLEGGQHALPGGGWSRLRRVTV